MKIAKGSVLLMAFLAMAVSIAPMLAEPVEHQDPGSGTGGGSAIWTVTCNYNQQGQLVSRSCTSGGTTTCQCP